MLYPIGIQNFEKLREEGFVYVDKTDKIYSLVSNGGYYFLSRPRRFGKSLLVSTMEAYFQGRRELFKGLAIDSLEKEWVKYPVLHLSLGGSSYSSMYELESKLAYLLGTLESEYGIWHTLDMTDSVRFSNIIRTARSMTGRKVAVLIDEYDKPLIDNIDDRSLYDQIRRKLQGLYSVIKEEDSNICFGFLTGVTKIGKLSIFSGLNNLNDISMDAEYSDICGISENELYNYFQESIQDLAAANRMDVRACLTKLKEMYDGYHFCENSMGVYNPFSLLNTFQKKKFQEYWFETGTPTFLVDVIRKTSFDVSSLSEQTVDSTLMGAADAVYENPVPMLFQSGYLTIKDYNGEYGFYTLTFPNLEVKRGFLNYLLKYYTNIDNTSGTGAIYRLSDALQKGRPEEFLTILSSLFARAPYQIQGNAEKDFQYAIWIIVELLGIHIQAERQTSNGRIDLLIQTKEYIYVIELKVDSTADEALKQIEEKGYARPFAADPRRLYKIGVCFSTATRRIEDWKII